MTDVLTSIIVDLNSREEHIVWGKEGENKGRGIEVILSQNGNILSRAELDTYQIYLLAKTSKGNVYKIQQSDDMDAITFYYPSDIMVPGTTLLELHISKDDKLIISKNFNLEIEKSLIGEVEIPEGNKPLLSQLLDAAENETKRIAAEDIREENEKSRVSNHTAMQESIRRWSLMMQDWIQAEEERVLSEKTRKDLFNQMKKEFDEMMEILGDNPIGNLTQELQALKNTTDKHFKSVVVQGDDLVLIREDLTELTIPLDLTKYATVKQLEELSGLLNTTKTQLEMKIGNKANITYVDEKLLNKADKEHKHYATDISMSTSSAQSVSSRITSIESSIDKKADTSTVNQSYSGAKFIDGKLRLIKHNDTVTELNIGKNIDIGYSDSQPNITLAKTGNIVVLSILEETKITNGVIATTIPYGYRPKKATTVSVAYHNNSTSMVFYTFKIWGGGELTCTFTTISEAGDIVTNRKDGTIKENLSVSYMI